MISDFSRNCKKKKGKKEANDSDFRNLNPKSTKKLEKQEPITRNNERTNKKPEETVSGTRKGFDTDTEKSGKNSRAGELKIEEFFQPDPVKVEENIQPVLIPQPNYPIDIHEQIVRR